jgi:rod shape-determining protein MreD
MTRGIWIVATIYLAAVVDTVVAPLLAIRGVAPDFLALAAMLTTFVVRGPAGIVVAAVAGGVADLNSPGRYGVGMAAFGMAAFAIDTARTKALRRPLAQAAVTFAAVAVISLGTAVVRGLLRELAWSPAAYVAGAVGAGLYTAVAALPCVCLLDRFAPRRAGAL